MNEVLEANIFFFITGIAVIVSTVLFSVMLYHVIRILKSIRRVIDRIEAGSEIIADDMQHLRTYFIEGSLFSRVLRAFMGVPPESRSQVRQNGEQAAETKKQPTRSTNRTELKIKNEE